jgi:hypothetical protein
MEAGGGASALGVQEAPQGRRGCVLRGVTVSGTYLSHNRPTGRDSSAALAGNTAEHLPDLDRESRPECLDTSSASTIPSGPRLPPALITAAPAQGKPTTAPTAVPGSLSLHTLSSVSITRWRKGALVGRWPLPRDRAAAATQPDHGVPSGRMCAAIQDARQCARARTLRAYAPHQRVSCCSGGDGQKPPILV